MLGLSDLLEGLCRILLRKVLSVDLGGSKGFEFLFHVGWLILLICLQALLTSEAERSKGTCDDNCASAKGHAQSPCIMPPRGGWLLAAPETCMCFKVFGPENCSFSEQQGERRTVQACAGAVVASTSLPSTSIPLLKIWLCDVDALALSDMAVEVLKFQI
ncbi:unnamed protein product [Symbiodinium natans]|uniref:Uncharacterized protein n=1 Tax=Symbiodinium natans TaxID=878477 RepID=A0A812NQE8_9DINO|nr:unnamed protein product [Symbiodinium natans]